MLKFSDRFEKIISMILLVFSMLVIVFQVIELFMNTVESFSQKFHEGVGFAYAPEYTRSVVVLFFNVLLMMEIMQTIKVFSHSHINKVRIILIVCVIAVSRKILALGEETVDPVGELALAGMILSLAASYFLVTRQIKEPEDNKSKL